ncbi:Phosphoenolpyruvate synthase/pyruvate phosphate dikinase PpsA [Methanonatronarchaeum thermophilum]|uniref:Probable phosphoenolpyruvate synthase n=1 Tax=Methanonatronarchaeum thermophilum TaxID=1927129 RepID=A0A1Y3GFK7_9EURY|nr:Phosphoenolpyruvate synthase/pyruvate phosphate dikinase PpsA [Methanonatronarchaeum thermophilum]
MIIAWIDEVDNTDLELVGGKGASLGELKQAELPVPDAFVVTAETFRRFIVDSGIDKEIFKILDETNVDNSEELQKASQKIKEIIIETETPEDIKQEVNKAYEKISEKAEGDNEFVAIRSSATAEDLPDASFAGQQETFLNIRGQKNVMEKIKECWASLYTARAIFYREKQNFEHSKVNIAVVVQRMVNAEKAGVIFTSHPTTGEDDVIIEAGWGLGEGVVSGSVSPDHYIINKKGFEIKKRDISTKRTMFDRDPETGETRHVDVPEDMMDEPTLTDEEITELAKMGEGVEKHYKTPQDVEWAIEDNEIYMLQSRPITTITDEEIPENETSGEIIVEGLGASPGIGAGTVKIVKNLDELDKVKEGDILVTSMTTPDMVPAMKKASAIVTDEGGLTCHAAIVSRELSTPAVVGANGASKTLKDGEEVTVDGEKGKIYKGKIKKEKTQKTEKTVVKTENNIVTATDIKVNVSIPEAAERAAQTGADGVGLLRIEHLVLGLNRHPQSYAEKGEQEEFIRELENGIRKVADEFYPKPVWIRTLDAPTDEFRSLEGGDREPEEHNPMLGFRGIRRDLKYTEIFEMQIKAIKKLIEKGYTNLGLMLPLIQHPKEVKQAKEMMKEHNLDLEKIDFGIMVETPAASLIIEDIIKEDIDFISFGTNDLTQYTLAVDRNNERVSGNYDERHPAVLKLIERVIEKCNEADVKTSICGQAGSYPDIVDRLVNMGITSVSANIDSVREIRKTVAKKEKQMLLDSIRK